MNDKQKSTIDYYNTYAAHFFNDTVNADMGYVMNKFTAYLPDRGIVLDAGCGSGRDTLKFKMLGYEVAAFDASEKLARKASEYTGINVACRTFEDVNEAECYDGIWACASLLHVDREHLQSNTEHLVNALKENGIIYVSFKLGDTEREKNGRFFCDMNEESTTKLLNSLGVTVLEAFVTGDVRQGRDQEQWINVIGRKSDR